MSLYGKRDRRLLKVSTNWRDDYLMKLGEYEKLGIAEYWIVDNFPGVKLDVRTDICSGAVIPRH
jgi:hypothetical protein